MNMANTNIKSKDAENHVKLWKIADKLGITDGTFSKKLRKELTAEEKAKILEIIDEVAAERSE